jgi:phosphoglycolate phosphatase
MAQLILFDIDGTLIYSGGAGARAMDRALEELTGISNGFRGIDCSGKTDLQIISEALQNFNLNAQDGLVSALLDRYVVHLKVEVATANGHMKPGVLGLLRTLRGARGPHLGLLTGNIEQGARVKLAPFGLNPFFPFGAFGNDAGDRNRLLPIAVRRLRENTGISICYGDCVVVGDTPRDVACAKIHGAACIAVATGTHSLKALQATEADLVVQDLSQAQGILDWLSTISRQS